MENCDKHGPYSVLCRMCDLETIEKYAPTNTPGRAAARKWFWSGDSLMEDWPDKGCSHHILHARKDGTLFVEEGAQERIIEAVNTHDALQAENERLRERVKRVEGERDKLKQSYRCYSCKQIFEEDHGHGLASEHFGSWLKGDRPKCEDCLRGTATWGGGAHDPFYRVRKEAYEQLIKDSEALKRLRAEQEADSDDNALWS